MILVGPSRLCFSILVNEIDKPILAHIHKGAAGENGGVVVDLVPPNTGLSGTSAGCVDDEPATLTAIRNSPSKFYVNVHTGAFSGGALRGQLF